MKHIKSELLKLLVTIISVMAVTGVASAINFAEPSLNPPAGNASAPINVGATGQTKTGDFWADSVGSNDGYCLGQNCVTSWPAGATGINCHLETRVVTNQDPQSSYTVGSGCTVSPTDAAGGWIVTSWDHCSTVRSRDCQGPKYCTFSRLVCGSGITIQAGAVTRL